MPPQTRRAIHGMSCICVKNCNIARYYKVHLSTVSKLLAKNKMHPRLLWRWVDPSNYRKEASVCSRSM